MNVSLFLHVVCWVSIVTWVLTFWSCVNDYVRNPFVVPTPHTAHTVAAVLSVVALLTL